MIQLLFDPNIQFSLKNGAINTAGILNVYHNSDTDGKYPVKTYSDPDGTLNPIDIVLDNNGRATVYVDNDFCYRLEVFDSNKNLLWTTSNIQPANGIAIKGTYVFSIKGDEYIDVKSETVGSQVNYSLNLSDDSKGAIDGYYDETTGNQALYDLIQKEAQTRESNDSNIYNTLNNKVTSLEGSLTSEVNNRKTADSQLETEIKESKTEVKNTDGTITVTETKDPIDNHSIYTISGVEQTPNVTVTSEDESVTVTEKTVGNNKTFDLSVIPQDNEYGKFFSNTGTIWRNVGGNMSLSGSNIKLTKGGIYHITALIKLNNTKSIGSYDSIEIYTGDSTYSITNVDCSITGFHSYELSWDQTATLDYLCTAFSKPTNFTISSVFLHIHRVDKGSVGSSGGSGDNDKVSVSEGKTSDYLKNVLVSDSDEITLTEVNNQLRIGLNLTGESDPKIATCDESIINSATSNYGSMSLKDGYTHILWNDTSYTSYSWMNGRVYLSERLSEAQGTITKCNIALCGSISNDDACLNVGIFDHDGTLLGQTGLKYYLTDFQSGTELCSFDMVEEYPGSLQLKRNTRYYMQLWSCALQVAGFTRGETFNYDYDFTLKQNVMSSISQPVWKPISEIWSPTQTYPYLSFGASDLS